MHVLSWISVSWRPFPRVNLLVLQYHIFDESGSIVVSLLFSIDVHIFVSWKTFFQATCRSCIFLAVKLCFPPLCFWWSHHRYSCLQHVACLLARRWVWRLHRISNNLHGLSARITHFLLQLTHAFTGTWEGHTGSLLVCFLRKLPPVTQSVRTKAAPRQELWPHVGFIEHMTVKANVSSSSSLSMTTLSSSSPPQHKQWRPHSQQRSQSSSWWASWSPTTRLLRYPSV